MANGSNIVSAIHHLKMATEFLLDFERQHPGSKGAVLMKDYRRRLDWIFTNIITHPFLPEAVRVGIKAEWNSDVFAVPAIAEKIALLNPEQREAVEFVIEQCIAGEALHVEHIKANL